MSPELQIDRTSNIPVYCQIIANIASLIRTGALKPGDRLPPERELSVQLNIARGTIAKAYQELTRSGILEVAPGRGSFVSARQDAISTGRKEKAQQRINSMLNELTGWRFSYHEIKNLIDLAILEREEQFESFGIALIDCNPEALNIFYRQLEILSKIHGTTILLDDLAVGPDPEKRLAGFNLIVTTATHYSNVLKLAPALKDRIVQVVVSPGQETVIHLAGLKPSQTIGILCESQEFLGIIKRKLENLRLTNRVGHLFWPCRAEQIEAFIADKDVLVVPPIFPALLNRETAPVLTVFTQNGGRIITFDYQIEQGSMVYLEERIKELTEP